MNQPLVSICIPIYNGASYLAECMNSVIQQTYANIEVIITDDQSTDNSIEIAKSFAEKNKRIKLFLNEKNLGLVGNWNQCIKHANGEWIKFLFQDDFINPNCISRMIEFANPSIQLITCNREFFFQADVKQKIKNEYQFDIMSPQIAFNFHHPIFINSELLSKQVAKTNSGNFIGEPTVALIRTSIFNELGAFNKNLVQLCDFEFWLRIATNYGLFYIPETLAFFRVHNSSTTANNRETRKELIDSVILIHDLLHAKVYAKFRTYTTALTRYKFSKLLKLRLHEAYLLSKESETSNLKTHIENVLLQYNFSSSITRLSALDKSIFNLMLLRRKIYQIQKERKYKNYAQQ